jgi:hypothetical protein
VLAAAGGALRSKDFLRARMLEEQALAWDPDNTAPKELIAKIATAASVAAAAIEDETVDLHKGDIDPDATAVFAPVQDSLIQRWMSAVRQWFTRVWTTLFARSSPGAAKAQAPARSGTNHKEA